MDRILLFVFAAAAAGAAVAGLVVVAKNPGAGVLYFLGALFLSGLAWRSWRRVAAAVRHRRTGGTLLVLLVAGSPAMALGQSPADSVRALDSAWARSYATQDTNLAKLVFADDLVITSTTGALKDKRAELADVAPQPDLHMEYFRTADVAVRMYGGAAVVTGLAEWRFTYRGTPTSVRRRYTAVYARTGPRWQMVALQLGRAPE